MQEQHQPSWVHRLFLSSWHPYAWIAVTGFILYLKTLSYQLTYYDDDIWLIESQWFFEKWSHVFQFFLRPDFIADFYYRPVFHLFFMLDSKIYGGALWGYRLTNILLHVVNAGLVFSLFQKLKYDRGLAFCFSLIFVVHPVLTMSVAWIPGRTETTWSLFFLLSFISFLNFLATHRQHHYLWHLVFFILALFTKETAVAIPFVAGVYFYFLYEKPRNFQKGLVLCLTWFFILVTWWAVRSLALMGSRGIPLSIAASSVVGNAPSLLVHLGKVFYPLNLCVTPVIEDVTFFFGALALLTAFFLTWFYPIARKRYFLFGVAWCVLFLLPGLVITLIFFEYRVYLSLVGVMIALMETGFIQKLLENQKRLAVFTAVIVGCFTLLTFRYSSVFRDSWTFWRSSVKCSKHLPVAYTNLGRLYQLDGQLGLAKDHYARALLLFPEMQTVRRNLGDIYVQEGRFQEAEREYFQEILFNPTDANTLVNFALMRYQQGHDEQARALLNAALEVDPDLIKAYFLLIFDYFRTGDQERVEHYVKALEQRGFQLPDFLFSLKF